MFIKQIHVVGAVIVDKTRGYLCALRGKGMSQAGLWEFPGGKIEPGEDPEQALQREIKEELGCEISVGPFITSCVYDYPTVRVRLDTYFARLTGWDPVAKEHERLQWFPKEQLAGLAWAPADLPTVEKILSGQEES